MRTTSIYPESTVVILILAAGSSSRMGRPKQLLPWGDQTLLTQAVKTAQGLQPHAVVVVIGSNAEEHENLLRPFHVHTVVNDQWTSGMGSSIKAGFGFIVSAFPQTKIVIVTVCDQPFVTTEHLQNLLAQSKESSLIVATKYADTFGVPVLFPMNLREDIMALPHGAGAKKLIEKHLKRTSFVVFEDGKIDLDTPDDYAKFVR